MAEKRKVIIDVESTGVNETANSVDKLKGSFKEAKQEASGTNEQIQNVTSNGGAIAILDSLTGGLATKFRDAYEATKLFNFSLKGTRTALIATGIGALVVGVGLLIAYWDDVVEFIGGANEKLETQLDLINSQQGVLESRLDLLREEEAINERLGKSNEENRKEQEKTTTEIRKQTILALSNLQSQLKIAQSKVDEKRNIRELIALEFERQGLNEKALKVRQDFNIEYEEEIKRVDDLNKSIIEQQKILLGLNSDNIDANAQAIADKITQLELEVGITDEVAKRTQIALKDAVDASSKRIEIIKENESDITKSYEERLGSMNEIIVLQTEIFESEFKSAEISVNRAQAALDLAKQKFNLATDQAEKDKLSLTIQKAKTALVQAESSLQAVNANNTNKLIEVTKDKLALVKEEKDTLLTIADLDEDIRKARLEGVIKEIENERDRQDVIVASTELAINNTVKKLEKEIETADEGSKFRMEKEKELELFKVKSEFKLSELKKKFREENAQADMDDAILGFENEINRLTNTPLNYFNNEYDLALEAVNAKQEILLSQEGLTQNELTRIQQEGTDARIAIFEAEANNRAAIINTIGQGLTDMITIAGAVGEESKDLAIASVVVEKAAAIAGIISNTALANAKAIAISPVSGGQPWVTINNIAAGLGIGATIASASKAIGEINNPSSSVGGGGDRSTSSSTNVVNAAPQFNIVGNSTENQIANALGDNQNQNRPQRTYVVSEEMTNNQELDRRIEDSASFG